MTDPTAPLTDQQLAAVETGRAAVRAKFSGGAFPAALGRAIADELADAAMAPLLADNARLRATVARLATAAENGKHSLAAFVADTFDPGSAALGALYLLQGALAGQPDTEPAYPEVTPEHLMAAGVRHAAAYLRNQHQEHDADIEWAEAAEALEDTAAALATPACTCRAEPVHQAGCPAS